MDVLAADADPGAGHDRRRRREWYSFIRDMAIGRDMAIVRDMAVTSVAETGRVRRNRVVAGEPFMSDGHGSMDSQ